MNIGHTLRTLMGELRTGEARTLELRLGQVVRGVVTRIGEDRQATVTINGVSVQALMEAGLKVGDAAWLQVLPPGADGAIRLKLAQAGTELPLPAEAAPLPELADQLGGLGLAATKGNRQAAALLAEANLPLSAEDVRAVADALRAAPAGTPKEAWTATVRLALAKGLPLSAGVLEALHAVTQGEGPDGAFAALAERVQTALQAETGAALGQGGALLRELSRLLGEAADAVERGVGDVRSQPARAELFGLTDQAESSGPAVRGVSPGTDMVGGTTAPAPGREGSAAVGQARSSVPQAPAAPGASAAAGAEPGDAAVASARAADESAVGAEAGSRPERSESQRAAGNWLVRMLEDLGLEHESRAARLPAGGSSPAGPAAGDAGSLPSGPAATLKEALLLAVGHGDLPDTVKEAARQALLQLTGQQLLLSGNREQLLGHTTVLIPFYNEEGRRTAAVHVEARRKGRGELDADNCRLVFDLSMRSLGALLVDVQVTDRSVGIRVLNDHERSEALFAGGKQALSAILEASGYRLAYLQTGPYPEWNPASGGGSDRFSGKADSGLQEPLGFQQKPYKGMDVRI
ncbi:hypothetical protein [Gorillibacterium sp. sgz500922]|uniref:hypothetical protein n=1 Tax=Gorillibacterium sp. sgz500922 TaxID=3446694 RepID=UPI003F66633C